MKHGALERRHNHGVPDMTTIEWTHLPGFRGESWNPVTGCTKVSTGCKNCYAEATFPRAYSKSGRKFTDVMMHSDRLDKPLRARAPRCYFVNSMSDLFHTDVTDDFIRAVWATMAAARQHRFIVLTKRPDRMQEMLAAWRRDGLTLREGCGAVLPNCWLGVSVEDQAAADERIPLLLQTPAAVRFVSYEPALGPVCFAKSWMMTAADDMWERGDPLAAVMMRQSVADGSGWMAPALDWIIVGGESGPKARPFDVQWARDTVRQCRAAGVACFVKQVGAWPVYRAMKPFNGPQQLFSNGEPLRDRKGADMSEWPEDLRVREWPR